MIAKQIEPLSPGLTATYNETGKIETVSFGNLHYRHYSDELIYGIAPDDGEAFFLGGTDRLRAFLDSVRHLREPEDEQQTCENCCEPVRKGKTCDTCRLIITNARKVEEASKDLEEAIELLREFVRYGKNRELDAWLDEIDRDVVCFLSRVGGDNE